MSTPQRRRRPPRRPGSDQQAGHPERPRDPSLPDPFASLRGRVGRLMARDQRRLRRRMDGLRPGADPATVDQLTTQLVAEIETAELRIELRRTNVPELRYPEELPVSQKRDDILAAIRDHQVVIVAGETGSGKTTQIPKICLELGRGVHGLIGHTQPRRLAARTVAERIAEELQTPLGGVVGWKVRFTDQVSDDTMVKLMTDGILLAEITNDRMLSQYDTLIIDEAHERSLNIDFILGYLKQLLPKRPDLKIIITSATIDPQRFSQHFGDAPIVEVSGRTYPVEVRYRPLVTIGDEDDNDDPRDQIQAICEAVEELVAEGPGDVLVFLSGEREIRDTADALRRLITSKRHLHSTEVLPLFARLSGAEQHRVFAPHAGRRIVLATNVAETSLTVPGIKYVVDPGTARISRYSNRLKVQRLPIEPVSQASANQRKGRCGRTSDGICVRLYDEEDFLARPEFTEPEILRTNLASVILQMISLGLGDLAAFPFVEPPDRRNIADGMDLLHELGALENPRSGQPGKLTALGRRLAQLPVDPRLARMLLEADRNGCVREVLIITAALSIQDPRERPLEHQQAAAQSHSRFVDKESDFSTYLKLWDYLREQQKELSSSQFRKMCKNEFLHYLRVREWQDLQSQLRQVVRGMDININDEPVDIQRVHQSLLAGLLSHIGLYDPEKREYVGARNAQFAVFPGSALFKKPPRWVMAAELVETSRLWARVAASIQPEWAEALAGHLVKRQYSEPHWSSRQAAVLAYEKVTLYGVPLVAKRPVNFGRIDAELSRELFIRHALVAGEWRTHHDFWNANRALLEEVEELEHRARRRDIVVDDETLVDFYDARLPADIVSGAHFDAWWKKARHETPDLLSFEKSMLMNESARHVNATDYPDAWQQGQISLPLTYHFEPGSAFTPDAGLTTGDGADGVTVHIPLPLLNQVTPAGFDWQIPGLREDLIIALIRTLPKGVRRNFVPVPDVARALLAASDPGDGPLFDVLERQLRAMTGVVVAREAWERDKVPDHLRMTFRVSDEAGGVLGEDKDLGALQRRLQPKAQAAVAATADDLERTGMRGWDLDELPKIVERDRGGYLVKAFPALVDEGETLGVRVFDSAGQQWGAMWRGTRRLVQLSSPPPVKGLSSRLSNQAKLALSRNPHGSVAALLDDCVTAAVDKVIIDAGGPAWTAETVAALLARARAELTGALIDTVSTVEPILASAHRIEMRLKGITNVLLVRSLNDIRKQLSGLIKPGFVTAVGLRRLPDLVRYLTAIERRLDKLTEAPQWDRDRLLQIENVQEEYDDAKAALPLGVGVDILDQARWMIEELRVSLFAQALGTPYPVSDKRIYRVLATLPPG